MTGFQLTGLRLGRLAATAVAAGLMLWTAVSQGGLSDCVDAACRITSPDGSRGTGCVFEIQHGMVYVLTAAHVIGQSPSVECEFWSQGHQSQPLGGRVTARSAAADAAIITLPEAAFAGRLPAAIPLAPRGSTLRPGQTLASVGCANGGWSTAWKGHVLECRDDELRFVPVPANGRSGSALFDAESQQIVGVVRARTGDSSAGIATPLVAIYRAFDGPARGAAAPQGTAERGALQPVQCGPNGCPAGGVPAPNPGEHFALPYRQNVERQIDGLKNSSGPWPTLPPPPAAAPPPAPAAVPQGPDPATTQALGELGRAVDRNASDVQQLRDQVLPRAIDQAVRPLGERISAIDQTVKPLGEKISAIDSALKPLSEKLSAVDAAVQPLERIKERLDADIAGGGLRGKLAQHIEDLASGKLESNDPKLRLILITLIVVAVAGAAVFLVIRGHQAASSLSGIVTQAKAVVDAVAAKAPLLAPVATGLDSVGNLILKQLSSLQSQQAAPTAAPAAITVHAASTTPVAGTPAASAAAPAAASPAPAAPAAPAAPTAAH
jgi:hypothetical protein